MKTRRRRLPSVDRLLATRALGRGRRGPRPRPGGRGGARRAGGCARAALLGDPLPSEAELAEDAARWLAITARGTLHPVINATGVIIHTNLGRAPLSHAARQAMEAVAAGYSNLEYDLEAGERGSRYVHAEELLCRLTGAEAALVVNNNAGAVFLALSALARGREVVISRGQLVEIGGGFRIPDVLRQSGARLVEVGTTNRTHLRDFRGGHQPRDSAPAAGALVQLQADRLHRGGVAGRHGGAGARRRAARGGRPGQRHPAGHRALWADPPSRPCRTASPPAPTW